VFFCKQRGRQEINWRHNLLRDCLYRLVQEAGGSARREPAALSAHDQKRPDLEVVLNGESILVDVTVRVPTAPTYLVAAAIPRNLLRIAEQRKHARYDGMAAGVNARFVPVAFDIFGGFGEEGAKFLALLSSHAEDVTGARRSDFYRYALGHLACTLVYGNARVYSRWRNQR
jgi:hypothetical protein